MAWSFCIPTYSKHNDGPFVLGFNANGHDIKANTVDAITSVNNCTVYYYAYGFSTWSETTGYTPGSYKTINNIEFRYAVSDSNTTDDDIVFMFVKENNTGKIYAVYYNRWNTNGANPQPMSSLYAGPGYTYDRLPNNYWRNALDNSIESRSNRTYREAAAAAAAAAWPSLQSLSVPTTTTTLSSANSTKSTAQGYWNTISQAGSGWANYSAAQSKYNEIVTAVSNIEDRDTRLNKKADKTELNASNSKVRPEYTTPYTKGTEDYTSIKSTLTAVNKRLNS